MMQINHFSLPIILGVGFITFLMRLVASRNRGRVVSIFMMFNGLVILYSLFFFASLSLTNQTAQLVSFYLMVFCATFIPPAILFFLLEYLGYDNWINGKSIFYLLAVPVVSGLLELTDPLHGLFWENVEIVWHGGYSYINETPGLIPIILTTYLYFIMGISIALLSWAVFQTPWYRRRALNLIIVALTIPTLFDMVRLFGLNPRPHLYITPYGILISVLLLGISIIRYEFLNVIPAAYNRLFSEVSDAILVFDHKMNILDMNMAARELFFKGMELDSKLSASNLPEDVQQAFKNKESEVSLIMGTRNNYYDLKRSEIVGKDGILRSMMVTFNDISWRKRTELQLQELIDSKEVLLREKEVLMREIHHRVKNNFNLAGSLLFLEARKFKDVAVHDAFEVSRDRLRTMSLLNERLYRTDRVNDLELGGFLCSIAEDLIRSQSAQDTQVILNCETDETRMNPKQAIPCGLIVNELVTNSLKHAFLGGDIISPAISLKLIQGGEGLVMLHIEDNGSGYPESYQIEKSNTLGMQLVHMLGQEQLGGTVEVGNQVGAYFKLAFYGENEQS